MATPNYGYEKRQRELAKKKKQEEKRQSKLERAKEPRPQDDAAPGSEQGTPDAPGADTTATGQP